MSRPPLTRAELDEQARRLVEAAFHVSAANGNLDPPVRELLDHAGLSRQALYRSFGSKDGLMAAALTEGTRILAEYLTARVDRAATPIDQVRAWVDGVLRQAQAPSAAARTRPFVIERLSRPSMGEEAIELLVQPLEKVIGEGTADGSFASTDPAGDALVIHDLVFASMRRFLVADRRPPRSEAARLADFALRGLGAPVRR